MIKRWLLYLFVLMGFLFACGSARAQFPCTSSPNIGFQIPNIGNTTTWGLCLNTDLGIIDSLLGGTAGLATSNTTPSIAGNANWITGNIGIVTITNLLGGYQGQVVRIICGTSDTFTGIASSANIILSSGWSCSSSKAITLVLNGAVWIETARYGPGSGGGSSPGLPLNAMQYNNATNLAGSNLLFFPNAATPTCQAGGSLHCDEFNFGNGNTCMNMAFATDSTISFGNTIAWCNTGAAAITGGTSGAELAISSEVKLPSQSAVGIYSLSSVLGTGLSANAGTFIVIDDPLDTGTGQTYEAIFTQLGLTRASGGISEMDNIFISTPVGCPGGAPCAETALNLYGIRIQDQKAKGSARTAALQIDAQTTCGNCFAIKVDGGVSEFDGNVVIGGGSQIHEVLLLSGASISPPWTSIPVGSCDSRNVTVTGAAVTGVAWVSPTAGIGGFPWTARVSATNTVNIQVCSIFTGTPPTTTWNVAVMQ